jgi:membrane-associated protease RseP (regulator of RpoE activity)
MRTTLIALIVATASVAAAAPATKPADADNDNDVSVTWSTGRGRLGFAAIQISPELRTHLGAPSDRGVLVDSVRTDSPAAKAGVKVGDIVLSVDGASAKSAMSILDAIGDRKKGDKVAIDVQRGNSRLSLSATLEDDAGTDMRAFGRFQGSGNKMMPMDPNDMGTFFGPGMFDQDMQRSLDELRKRMDQLEHKLDTKRT